MVAIIAGTKSQDICAILDKIEHSKREIVEEITLDLSDSMRKIVRYSFPNAKRVIDRFHIQKLACDAVQEMRIAYRWDAIQESNDEMEEAKLSGNKYKPHTFENGDTKKELLVKCPPKVRQKTFGGHFILKALFLRYLEKSENNKLKKWGAGVLSAHKFVF